MADRWDYFRAKTMIGKLELEAMLVCDSLGHDYIVIRDDRHASSFGCIDCNIWGCVESGNPSDPIHGSIFSYRCGEAPKLEVDDDSVDILGAIYGS